MQKQVPSSALEEVHHTPLKKTIVNFLGNTVYQINTEKHLLQLGLEQPGDFFFLKNAAVPLLSKAKKDTEPEVCEKVKSKALLVLPVLNCTHSSMGLNAI